MDTIEMVAIDLIDTCRIQPERRTWPLALKKLERAIVATGGRIINPLAVFRLPNGRFVVSDGHRRMAVAKKLGMTHVPARVITEGTPEGTWSAMNSGTEKISAANWFTTWARCRGDRDEWLLGVPKIVAYHIRRFAEILGTERAVEIAREEWCDPGVVKIAERIAVLISRGRRTDPSKKQVLEWVIQNKKSGNIYMHQWERKMGTLKTAQERMRTAIIRGVPHPPSEW